MMARQHVASGYAGYIATVSTLGGTNPMWHNAPRVGWLEPMATPIALLLASVVCAAFAIWSDIDHPGSTVSKKLGIIGSILSPLVRMFAFGHRGLTHTWVFVALNAVGVMLLSQLVSHLWGEIASRILVAVLLALSALLITRLILPGNSGKGNAGALVAAGLVALVALHPDAKNISWMPLAVGGGVLIHCIGDSLTTGGTKFLFPFPVKIALPIVGNTNSWIERLIAGPIFTFTNVLFTLMVVVFPLFPAVGAELNKASSIAPQLGLSWTMVVVFAVTIFDFATRVIAGKPQFAGH